jgi:hypothetical protein
MKVMMETDVMLVRQFEADAGFIAEIPAKVAINIGALLRFS